MAHIETETEMFGVHLFDEGKDHLRGLLINVLQVDHHPHLFGLLNKRFPDGHASGQPLCPVCVITTFIISRMEDNTLRPENRDQFHGLLQPPGGDFSNTFIKATGG